MPTKRESKKEQGRGESLIVPMTVIMMRQGYDYWQNKVLLAIIDKLQPYIREGLQIDLFGIQEDIILSIRYKDLGIRRADYSKFRSRLATLSLIPVIIPSTLNNESYHRYHRLGTVFFEEGDSKDFMIQLDKDVVHHIISKEYGYCELSKDAFLACKSRYSQQIYLMLASWRNEGEHRIPLKELEAQMNQDSNSLELSRTSTKKSQPAPTIQNILNEIQFSRVLRTPFLRPAFCISFKFMKFDFLGPEIRVSDGQPLNTLYPIFFNVFGKMTVIRLSLCPNALSSTFTTPSGTIKTSSRQS